MLVVGASGTGKTSLQRFFKKNGKNALDGDICIGMWLNARGDKVKMPIDMGRNINKWAEDRELSWVCDTGKLKRLLSRNKGRWLYLFGGPLPPDSFLRFFDRIYYLDADKKLILKRLKIRLRDADSYHNYGETKKQREQVLRDMASQRKRAKEHRFRFIDASLPPQQIFDIMTKQV